MKRRKAGFYWVMQDFEIGWEIALWNNHYWLLFSNTGNWQDNNFIEIDEHPIIRQSRRIAFEGDRQTFNKIDGSKLPELKNLTNPK